MKISDLKTLDPTVPWLEYINTILGKDVVQVTEEETIIVPEPDYVANMKKLMSKTPTRVQANYLLWRTVDQLFNSFGNDMQCVRIVETLLPKAVGSSYVKNVVDEEYKELEEMVAGIRDQFGIMVQEAEWLEDETKERGRKKAASVVEHIGYPTQLLDTEAVSQLYEGLELSSEDPLGNIVNLTLYNQNYSYGKLREEVNKTDWNSRVPVSRVSAEYYGKDNSIYLSAGILKGVFYGKLRPKYMNFGAIGWVIGHEICHGFDDQNRQFDYEGNLVNWWQPKSLAR